MIQFNALIPAIALIPSLAAYPFSCVMALLLIGGFVQEHAQNPEKMARETLGLSSLLSSWVTGVDLPDWAIELPFLLLILGGIIYEWGTARSTTAQENVGSANRFVNTAAGAAIQYGVVNGQMAQIIEILARVLPGEVVVALSQGTAVAMLDAATTQPTEGLLWLAQPLAIAWAISTGIVIWLITGLRAGLITFITEVDPEGDLGLLKLFALGEGGWALTSTMIVIFFPLLALILAGITMLVLWLIQRYFERREQKTLIVCHNCNGQLLPMALACPNCQQPNPQPRMVGWFGQARTAIATNLTAHRTALIGNRRCPNCATRFPQRDVQQACPACATVTFADTAQINTFLRTLDTRLPRALLVTALLSLVPVIGVVPAIIYYRLSLIASLRSYVPITAGCVTRWLLGLVGIFLIAFQPVPLFGALAIPILCLISYTVHRQLVYRHATGKIGRATEQAVQGGRLV